MEGDGGGRARTKKGDERYHRRVRILWERYILIGAVYVSSETGIDMNPKRVV